MQVRYIPIILVACALLLPPAVFAASSEPVWGRDGMVVTSVSPSAPVAQAILEQGGNAVDAAVAASFAAAVAHPFSSGLGGGFLAVIHDAKTGENVTLDAREVAPASASAAFYREHPDSIRSGPHSVAVPGFLQGLWAMHQRYGSMPWAELIKPAIAMAEKGVTIGIWQHNMVRYVADALAKFPETRRIQTIDGVAPPLGWKLVQSDLAKTLRMIQTSDGQALAVGPMARKIEQATDGVITALDLARFKVRWRKPVIGNYRGYQLVMMPLPSSGGVMITEMLNVLQRFDLAAMGHNSGDYIHLVAGVEALAFADRAQFLGDPDFVKVPLERLTSMAHADELAARLRPDGPPQVKRTLAPPPDDHGTTHISVLDRNGNAVALTQTINTLFGSKITVPGTGIVLNNEMDDFSIGPSTPNAWQAVGSAANAVQPGKRPLSSMTPLIVMKDGRAVMSMGASGGTMIISAVLQALLNTIDFGFDAEHAVMAPRFHDQWQPATLFLEPDIPLDVRNRLQALGDKLGNRTMIAGVQLDVYDPKTCYFWGGADGRRDSAAAGVNIGAVKAVTQEQRCAAISNPKASSLPK